MTSHIMYSNKSKDLIVFENYLSNVQTTFKQHAESDKQSEAPDIRTDENLAKDGKTSLVAEPTQHYLSPTYTHYTPRPSFWTPGL